MPTVTCDTNATMKRVTTPRLSAGPGDKRKEPRLSQGPTTKRPQLTARRREVLDLLLMGHCNKDIAAKLGIGENTVKAHIEYLFQRYGVMSSRELAAYVLKKLLNYTDDLPLNSERFI